MVLRRHGDVLTEELGECRIAVDHVGALGVDVEQVQRARPPGELRLDPPQQLLQHRRLEGVEEKEQRGRLRQLEVQRVLFDNLDRGQACGGRVLAVGACPVLHILPRDGCHLWVQLDAGDLAKAVLAGNQQGAPLARAHVDKDVILDWVRRPARAPGADQRAQNAGRNAVVRRDVLVVGVARDKVLGRDQAAGVHTMHLVEGMDGKARPLQQIAGAPGRWRKRKAVHGLGSFGFGFAATHRAVCAVAECMESCLRKSLHKSTF